MSKCNRFYDNPINACNAQTITYNCNPGEREYWDKPALPKNVDPVLYNVINGCWSCNHYVMEKNNQKLCNRQFFDGNVYPPCSFFSQ